MAQKYTGEWYLEHFSLQFDKMQASINIAASSTGFPGVDWGKYVPQPDNAMYQYPEANKEAIKSIYYDQIQQKSAIINAAAAIILEKEAQYPSPDGGRSGWSESREGNRADRHLFKSNPGLAVLVIEAYQSGMPDKNLRSALVLAANDLAAVEEGGVDE